MIYVLHTSVVLAGSSPFSVFVKLESTVLKKKSIANLFTTLVYITFGDLNLKLTL